MTLIDLSGISFVCVTASSHSRFGGSLLDPRGVIAVKTEHAPIWLSEQLDHGQLTAESSDDEEVKELHALVEAGHALVIQSSRTLFMHVDSRVIPAFRFESDAPQPDAPQPDAPHEEQVSCPKIAAYLNRNGFQGKCSPGCEPASTFIAKRA